VSKGRNWNYQHRPATKWQQANVLRKDPTCRILARNRKKLEDLPPKELCEVIDEGYRYFWSRRDRVPPDTSLRRWHR
jgi:hypothetical protein